MSTGSILIVGCSGGVFTTGSSLASGLGPKAKGLRMVLGLVVGF